MADLNIKQKQFCKEYIIDLNATQASIRAGYSKKTATVTSCKMLAKPNIQEYISILMARRSKRTEITADKTLKELALIGFSNMLDYIDFKGDKTTINIKDITREQGAALQEINVSDNKAAKIKLGDKIKALTKIGEHLNMFKQTVNHDGEIKLVIFKEEENL